jgi:transposase
MPKRYHIELSDEEREQLNRWVKNPPRPYLRKRAWAILLLAAGEPAYRVARDRRVRTDRSTLAVWVKRFQSERLAGLRIKPGRGRKPVYAPHSAAEARSQVETLLHRSPREFGIDRTRWRLQDVGRALAWLRGTSEPGIYKVLKRLGFSRKQALHFVVSPDPAYRAKWEAILAAFKEACEQPDQVVLLFVDELTYYRQPSKAPAYHARGADQPHADQSAQANTQTRIVAALNAYTGRVVYLQRSKIGQEALVEFFAQVRAAYPDAAKIYIVEDNWPTHKLPAVQEAMRTARLTPLFLPTYASWLNPIEKLWRWLKQDVLHLHQWAADLDKLREAVKQFLDRFADGSESLLRYVGLLPE